MTATLDLFVPGVPRPQGSKRHVGNGVMIESSKHTKGWRKAVTEVANVGHSFESEPVAVVYEFVMPRPKALKGNRWATQRPDIEKLARAISDSLSDAQVWNDDSQVVDMRLMKRTAKQGEETGVHIYIQSCERMKPF